MSQNINSPVYVLSATTTSQSITIESKNLSLNSINVTNEGAQSVFVVTSLGALTAVFPTSASVSVNGSVILTGQQKTFQKNPLDDTITLIRPAAASAGNVYIDLGANFDNY